MGLHLPTLLNDTSVLNSTLDFFSDGNDDGDFSSTRVFPGVPFDSESSKENQSKVPFLSTYSNVKKFEKQRNGYGVS